MNDNQKYKRQITKQAIRQVKWKDLRQLTHWQVSYNLILPFPFLLLSWWFASQSLFVFACVSTYLFFASAFRQAHDGYHYSLGVNKPITALLLMVMSVFLLTSLHTIKATHMQHHRHPLADDDVEGRPAKWKAWQALIGGVGYRLSIYREGFRLSQTNDRIKSIVEFLLIGVTLVMSLIMISGVYFNIDIFYPFLIELNTLHPALTQMVAQVAAYHLIVMFLANSCVALIAVWGVHHDAEDTIARTERNRLVNLLTFGLLFHVEHHLFPSIPSNNLPKLAERLDTALPQLTKNHVVPDSKQINSYIINILERIKSKYSGHNDNRTNNGDCPIRKRLLM